MRFERETFKEGATLETYGNLALFRLCQERAQRGVFSAVGGDANDAQRLAGREGFVNGVNPVDYVVKIQRLARRSPRVSKVFCAPGF
jgi:hypothetical protein